MSSTRSSLLSSAPASRVRFVAVVVVVVVFFWTLYVRCETHCFISPLSSSVPFPPSPSSLSSLFSLPPFPSVCLYVVADIGTKVVDEEEEELEADEE